MRRGRALLLSLLLARAPAAPCAPAPARGSRAGLVRTPATEGDVHAACVRAAPPGALLEALPDGRVRVTRAGGGAETLPPCAFEPRARPRAGPRAGARAAARAGAEAAAGAGAADDAADAAAAAAAAPSAPAPSPAPPSPAPPPPPTWNGWPRHWWLGLAYAPFTSPPLPAGESFFSVRGAWAVPPLPASTGGNASDPWGGAAPTESWWVGLQGGAVLQPVLELNGLCGPRAWGAVSWVCCPGGYVWHSDPLLAQPGDGVEGAIVRVDGAALGAPNSTYAFEVTTTLTPRAGGAPEATVLRAVMDGAGGEPWAPTWAEVVQESYFVTRCDALPCAPAGAFARLALETAPAGRPFNASPPAAVAAPPWAPTYAVEGAARPGAPVCGGRAAPAGARGAAVDFDCGAAHAG